MLADESESCFYPIVNGIPVLLGPERLVPADRAAGHPVIDLRAPRYAEAYEEMEHYNTLYAEACEEMEHNASVALSRRGVMGALADHGNIVSIASSFPEPARFWIDARHESLAQLEAYWHLSPVAGKTVLQIGGRGSHAVKMLLAGAGRAFLLTPVMTEARYGECLAVGFGVRDRFAPVLGIGEQVPFAADSIDIVYSGGCFHHMRFAHLGAELHRVLAAGGKFAGTDPWKTPLHTIGTALLGKREPSVYCRPITPRRLEALTRWFPELTANRHGPLLRYLFLGLEKLSRERFTLPVTAMMHVMRIDDSLGRLVGLEGYGGAVVIAGTKGAGAMEEPCQSR